VILSDSERDDDHQAVLSLWQLSFLYKSPVKGVKTLLILMSLLKKSATFYMIYVTVGI